MISIPTLVRDGHEAYTPRKKAEILRETHFPPPPEVDLRDIENLDYPEPVEIPGEIQEEEVRKAISATKKDKAPGPDGLPNRILHIIAGETLALLTRVFQACIDQGVHPDHFKEATIIMIRKPSKPDYINPLAYQPITLLNTLGKALKAVVLNRMRYLVKTYALLPQT